MEKIYNRLITIYFMVLIVYLQGVSIFYCYKQVNSSFISTGLVCFGVIGFILYVLYKFINKSFRIHDIFIIFMAIWGILSWKFSFVQRVALFGFKNGREGLLVILTYYVIFLLATTLNDKKSKKIILYTITVAGILNVIYSYLQVPGKSKILLLPIVDIWGYPSGFLSNSNFYGSYMVLLNGIWLSYYLFSNKEKIDYIALFILTIFLSGLLLSGAMSAIVALICMIFVSLVTLIYKSKTTCNIVKKVIIIRYLVLVVIFGVLYFVVSLTTDVNLNGDIKEMGIQAVSTITTGVDESFGTGRIHIWKEALYYFNKYNYWSTGIGIDNFYYLGHGHLIIDKVSGDLVYKAHNEYLQILVTEGVYMLITYLIFLIFIFIRGVIYIIKDRECDTLFMTFFMAFIGYSVQAFFSISMTRVAPLYFLMCGFVLSFLEIKTNKRLKFKSN